MRHEAGAGTGWKDEFDLGDRVYLNGANHGPFPRRAMAAIQEALEWKRDPGLIDDAVYFTLPDRIRAAGAPFFGCAPRDVAVVTGASAGISLVANGIDWRAGDEVVIPAGEFPANYLPWIALRQRGVTVRVLDARGGINAEDVDSVLSPSTRVVAVGHVNFATGFRADIDAIGELCRGRDIAYVVDASQSFATRPLDVVGCGATVMTAAGYKWMCSPYGTGLFFIDPEWVERLPPPVVNWEAVVGADDFNRLTALEPRYRPGAVRYDAPETASFLNCAGMAAALELLGEIGASAIATHTQYLLDRLIDGLPAGFRTDSVLDPRHRSSILRVVGRDSEHTRAAYERCVAARISVSLREDGIRIAPGVWNVSDDVDRFLDRLGA